jgi:lysophospholipase L1-like esterase
MTKKIAVLIVSLIAGLCIAEIAARVAGLAPAMIRVQRGRFRLSENPKLGYEPVPMTYSGNLSLLHHYRGSSNRLGFRDRDHDEIKPTGTYRVIVLGDSIADGIFIPEYKDTFPAIIEASLREAGHAVEIINMSVSGYNTSQEVEILKEKGLQFQPDLVLVAYCLNDIMRVDGGILEALMAEERAHATVNRYRFQLLHRSALFRFFKYVVFPYSSSEISSDQDGYTKELSENTVPDSFAGLSQLAEDHAFDVLIVVFPNFRQLTPYPFLSEHSKVRKLAEGNGFRYLDLLKDYQAYQDGEKLDFDYIHPTVHGHRCAARFISQYLLNHVPFFSRSPRIDR